MSKDDPKHGNGLDPVEDVEVVMLVGEYLEGLGAVEGLNYFV